MSDSNNEEDLNFNELIGNLLSSHNEQEHHVELPEFNNNDDDLVDAVANAIQDIDELPQHDNNNNVNNNNNNENTTAITTTANNSNDSNSNNNNDNDDDGQEQEWAQLLQNGLLNEENSNEQLDQDDENLRKAILESLQGLSTTEAPSKPAKKSKKKKKKHRKVKEPQPDNNDDDTQALVEATLKAFEKELMASSEQAKPKKKKKKAPEKPKITIDPSELPDASYFRPSNKPKKPKKKRAPKKTPPAAQDDEFSKVLADMVNQVVNTSLNDESTAPTNEPPNEEPFDLNQIMQNAMAIAFQEQPHDKAVDSSVMEEFNKGLQNLNVPEVLSKPTSKKSRKKKSTSTKKKDREVVIKDIEVKTKVKPVKEPKEPAKKPQLKVKPKLPEKAVLKKIYLRTVKEVANISKRKIIKQNKLKRQTLKNELQKIREEKKALKKQAKEKIESERKELEEIVARGPPYPHDLRVTKKGKPKKPYRRWTPEELIKRKEKEELEKQKEALKPKKQKKVSKKKTKKLKKVPLSKLKKIPLFNGTSNSSLQPKLEEALTKLASQHNIRDIAGTIMQLPISQNHKINSMKTIEVKNEQNEENRIGLHPPWMLPLYPPLSLPPTVTKAPRQSIPSKSQDLSFTNRLMPSILAPIINTLKIAARNKVNNGASPEETTRHLMTILEHTKKSIASSLLSARKKNSQMATAPKADVPSIPIFTLARAPVKSGNETVATKAPASNDVSITDNREKSEPISVSQKVSESNKIESEQGENSHTSSDREHLSSSNDAGNPILVEDENAENSETQSNIAAGFDNQAKKETEIKQQISISNTEDNSRDTKQGIASKEDPWHDNIGKIVPTKEIVRIKDENMDEGAPKVMGLINIPLKPTDLETKAKTAPTIKVENIVETLVKQQFNVDVTAGADSDSKIDGKTASNISNIITSTIKDLIPKLDNEKSVTKPIERKVRLNKVLNLDGLVPPVPITKIEPVPIPLQIIPKKKEAPNKVNKPSKNKKMKPYNEKSPSMLLYSFSVPNVGFRRLALLKRAKKHLTEDELVILNKELGKARKRKWREANVIRNWVHDLRSRLRKNASALFDSDKEAEKNQWIEENFKKKCLESEFSQEDLAQSNASDDTKNNNTSSTTQVTENEFLNIIAVTLNKLDVARAIEAEVNAEVIKREATPTDRPTKKRKLSAKNPPANDNNTNIRQLTNIEVNI
ncbi:hypothetical protein KAFR_0A06730 [Kazachstania africana CBS 2517]|uniref:DUF3020 domain-containing protein n=1 Tax=Kazachstania africana (strain ATCC 22294 / BCRC 22015 / CBS 2517 / CECT 1963 / NBRC 1671 / NRRL Y-8276) TaxID=1071382 RepID=H2AP08_KAZAF|nr:hypothetical protein KAFR_0A06730 [Kazachstania africana CBS 2517]CCF56108.1 hypothetical protein KAFR_0A06730 [Kazachstania africana CBS 2517]